jgi:competence protein ComEA
VKELSQLKRIGPAHAQKIVDYREKNGPFQNPQDITKVRGVGEKTWNQNKDRITVGPSNATQTQMGMKSF